MLECLTHTVLVGARRRRPDPELASLTCHASVDQGQGSQ
jgi:hypothetical protein